MRFYIKVSCFFSMEIPEKLVKNFKRQVCENVKVSGPSGNTWHVKMVKHNGKLIFQSGWKDFITANGIEKNDILVFKYNGNSSFEVVVFDPSGCEKTAPLFAKKMETDISLQESSDSSVQIVVESHGGIEQDLLCISSSDSETSNEISSDNSKFCITGKRVEQNIAFHGELDSEAMPQKRKKSGAQTRMLRPALLNKCEALMIKSPYIVPRNVHLTSTQEKIALEMSCAAKPGNAIFVKPLTSCNVAVERTCQINFPATFAPSLNNLKSQRLILRFYGKDKEWYARYFSSYPRGICGAGLRDFISENNFKKGDLCLFELMENEPKLAMTVHVFSM